MSDDIAREHLEHAVHESHGADPRAKRAAIIIAALAAMLAVCETSAKDAQTQFLSNHISASDTWSQYQAKSVRRAVLTQSADMMEALPVSEALQKHITQARENANRMKSEAGADGMEQLSERAHELEHVRDHAAHRHHGLEIGSGGLQLSIVLISVSVVTGIGVLMVGGGVLGLLAAGYALMAGLSIF